MAISVLLRSGGDLASGVAIRLYRAGLHVLITELAAPLVVRRKAAFAEAVYQGEVEVEGVKARRIKSVEQVESMFDSGVIPVLIDPEASILQTLRPEVLVDARMTKQVPDLDCQAAPLVIGLGPGFIAGNPCQAGINCHAVIETRRGHDLGRVIWEGATEPDTGIPEPVGSAGALRVLRATATGLLETTVEIGDHLEAGQLIARIVAPEEQRSIPGKFKSAEDAPTTLQIITAPFKGVLRGLLYSGLLVQPGMKIGDVDPRDDPGYCYRISDKSLAVGGGVLEAILSKRELRPVLWD
jgi:xanthine dehydrogenase accessory factor